MTEPQIKLTEVKTTGFIELEGTPQELYDFMVTNDLAKGSFEQFLYKISLQLTRSPCTKMRFHLITKEKKGVMFIVDSVKIAEALDSELGTSIGSVLENQKSWRQFRKAERRRKRRSL